jgi:hypothetical protein
MVKLAGQALALVAMLAFILVGQCALSCSLTQDNHACCSHTEKSIPNLQTLPAIAAIPAHISYVPLAEIDQGQLTTFNSLVLNRPPSISILRI